jgi:hypothetical protein
MHGELGELMRSADNRTVNVGIASPGADGPKNQTVTASMDGPNHVLIDYTLDTGVSGLAGNGKHARPLGAGRSRLTATMQVRVATADLLPSPRLPDHEPALVRAAREVRSGA